MGALTPLPTVGVEGRAPQVAGALPVLGLEGGEGGPTPKGDLSPGQGPLRLLLCAKAFSPCQGRESGRHMDEKSTKMKSVSELTLASWQAEDGGG